VFVASSVSSPLRCLLVHVFCCCLLLVEFITLAQPSNNPISIKIAKIIETNCQETMKILHHGTTQPGGSDDDLREHLHWKRCTTEKTTYVCMDRSRQVCAVLLSKAFVIELWDLSSLPSVMSRLTLCSPKPEIEQQFLPLWARDCQCQCMAWSDCKQYVCGVFGTNHKLIGGSSSSSSSSNSNSPSSVISVFLMWEIETGSLITALKYVLNPYFFSLPSCLTNNIIIHC
jgi:hypothetical protein